MSERDEVAERYLPLTDLAQHVLVAVADGPLHGYAIGKRIELLSDGRLKPTTGSLYQALRRLTRAKLIEHTDAPTGESIDARRQYFRMTALGRRVLVLETERLRALVAAAAAAARAR